MTNENLDKANELKLKIANYNNFLSNFKPIEAPKESEMVEGHPLPYWNGPRITLSASYSPAVLPEVKGTWTVTQSNSNLDAEIVDIINSVASKSLSSIGADIINAVILKLNSMQDEFDSL